MARKQNGFTLIEILVVIIITATLSGILILYSRTSEQQIILFRDQAKLIGLLFRAKSLAVTSKTTLIDTGSGPLQEIIPCAYGFNIRKNASPESKNFNKWEFRIFREFAGGEDKTKCLAADFRPNYIYDGPNEDMTPEEVQVLGENVKVVEGAADLLVNVVFIPPEPKVIINGIEATPDASIVIEALTGNQKTVKINNFGQITAQ